MTEYDDGSTYCFSANHQGRRDTQQKGHHYRGEEVEPDMTEFNDVAELPSAALAKRGIGEAAAERYGVKVEYDPATGEEAKYYFPLFKDGQLVGYQSKLAREPGSRQKGDVFRVGVTKGVLPFGSHVAGSSGKAIIVVEGAEDCLAAQELLDRVGRKYRVVSTLGTDGWKRTLEYFAGFQQVIIAYDQDSAGRHAASEFAAALKPGQGKIARWSGDEEDPNALLLSDGEQLFIDAIFKAEPYRPDGIVTGETVWSRMASYVEPAFVPLPEQWATLAERMGGIREAEITMLTGGSSSGKTAYTRALKAHILANTNWKIGEVELEERGEKTWRGVMESTMGKAWKLASPDERRRAFEQTYGTGRILTLDHRSQYGKGQSLVAKFKHLHYGFGCKALFLDHVTLAVNEFGDGSGLQAQDQMMNELLELVESTGVHLFLISHLRKAPGGSKSFEEGAVPTMDDLKGSGSLKQISFNILGISRNLMHDDEYQRNVSQIHLLKCRETGQTGRCDRLFWDNELRQLVPAREEQQEEGDEREF